MKGKCAKQTTVAIIINNGQFWVGSNWCYNPQEKCPREGMKTGEGYELCKSVCCQPCHAEVDACNKAGENARGGDLYLIGHYYYCDDCKQVMDACGINNIYLVNRNETNT